MTKPFNASGCWCCNDCPDHQVNQRQGYVIPCNAKRDCPTFQKYLTDNQVGNRLRTLAARDRPYWTVPKK